MTEIDLINREYHFELISNFKTYYNQSPLAPTNYFLTKDYDVWKDLYTYDDRKDWQFDPQQDTVYFYLGRYPYEPTIKDDPDSVGYYIEEMHTWSYLLRGNR